MKKTSTILGHGLFLLLLLAISRPAVATENSGCRRWHSCPSTRGSYVCGDLGYCGQCADNEYCRHGQARAKLLDSPPFALETAPNATSFQWIKVKKVVDGDTLVLKDRRKIRLIGIDTPEVHESVKLYRDAERSHLNRKTIQALGKRSWEIAQKLVGGRPVRLEYGDTRKDSHDRTLGYLFFRMPEGEFQKMMGGVASGTGEEREYLLNRVLVEYGYATVYPRFTFKYREEFTGLEREAQQAQRGLWKSGLGLLERTPVPEPAEENSLPPS